MHTKEKIMVALLMILSAHLLFAPVTTAEATPNRGTDTPTISNNIISMGRVTGPMIEANETTTTETPPPVLNPITIGLIGGIDIGIVVALMFFIVKRK